MDEEPKCTHPASVRRKEWYVAGWTSHMTGNVCLACGTRFPLDPPRYRGPDMDRIRTETDVKKSTEAEENGSKQGV
jgi:hypothetical protein